MKEEINMMIDRLVAFRGQAFKGQNEPLYKALGKAIGGLIDARQQVK